MRDILKQRAHPKKNDVQLEPHKHTRSSTHNGTNKIDELKGHSEQNAIEEHAEE